MSVNYRVATSNPSGAEYLKTVFSEALGMGNGNEENFAAIGAIIDRIEREKS